MDTKVLKTPLICILLLLLCNITHSTESESKKKEDINEKWKKKDVRDYTDADLERLLEQWEEDDEELEGDELPEWKRPKPKVDMSKLDLNNPEELLKMTKKGQTLMTFVSVSGSPTQKETESITQLWQSSLFNANYEIQRYVVGEDRAIFMVKDGSKAWEIKDYLTKQEQCKDVTIEGQVYPGRGAKIADNTNDDNVAAKSEKLEKSSPHKKDKKLNGKEDNTIRDEF